MTRIPARILACPQCGTAIDPKQSADRLDCRACALSYPVRDGVPVLLISEATARHTEIEEPEFEQLLAEALAEPFSGWDLSWLDDRCTIHSECDPGLIDQYDSRARELLADAASLLDLGTGGGEHIAKLAPLPPVSMATEAYLPNVPVAATRLAPLGVSVLQCDPNAHHTDGPQPGNRWPERRLPFASGNIDLVLARRSAFSPMEVARVLRGGGRVLTIQNGVEWRGETLADALGGTPPDWTLPGRGWNVGESFRSSGLRILDWREEATSTTYHDIGAIVFTLLHVPWLIVDFQLDRYLERLYRLHKRIQRQGPFTTRGYNYLIEAQKP